MVGRWGKRHPAPFRPRHQWIERRGGPEGGGLLRAGAARRLGSCARGDGRLVGVGNRVQAGDERVHRDPAGQSGHHDRPRPVSAVLEEGRTNIIDVFSFFFLYLLRFLLVQAFLVCAITTNAVLLFCFVSRVACLCRRFRRTPFYPSLIFF